MLCTACNAATAVGSPVACTDCVLRFSTWVSACVRAAAACAWVANAGCPAPCPLTRGAAEHEAGPAPRGKEEGKGELAGLPAKPAPCAPRSPAPGGGREEAAEVPSCKRRSTSEPCWWPAPAWIPAAALVPAPEARCGECGPS